MIRVSNDNIAAFKKDVEEPSLVYQQVIHKGRMVAEANLSALLGSNIVQKRPPCYISLC